MSKGPFCVQNPDGSITVAGLSGGTGGGGRGAPAPPSNEQVVAALLAFDNTMHGKTPTVTARYFAMEAALRAAFEKG